MAVFAKAAHERIELVDGCGPLAARDLNLVGQPLELGEGGLLIEGFRLFSVVRHNVAHS
jgi:hypothetical protein